MAMPEALVRNPAYRKILPVSPFSVAFCARVEKSPVPWYNILIFILYYGRRNFLCLILRRHNQADPHLL